MVLTGSVVCVFEISTWFLVVLLVIARFRLVFVAVFSIVVAIGKQNSRNIKYCIEHENDYYLSLMSQYIEKKDDIDTHEVKFDKLLISLLCKNRSKQLLCYFLRICKKCDVQFQKETISDALSQCKNEECVSMLNQY